MPEFLHARRDFGQLLSLTADERRIDPVLVEKDYWLMHCLWGLQAQGLRFELKGGRSLSKGFGIIHRFSGTWASCSKSFILARASAPSARIQHCGSGCSSAWSPGFG